MAEGIPVARRQKSPGARPGRSLNSHILVLIRENIQAFEREHGEIEGAIRPDVNVKPARKNGSSEAKI